MSESAIERAAQALCDHGCPGWDEALCYVGVVLQAIREPDGETMQAGNRVWLDGGNERQIYEAMIDAALAETPSEQP